MFAFFPAFEQSFEQQHPMYAARRQQQYAANCARQAKLEEARARRLQAEEAARRQFLKQQQYEQQEAARKRSRQDAFTNLLEQLLNNNQVAKPQQQKPAPQQYKKPVAVSSAPQQPQFAIPTFDVQNSAEQLQVIVHLPRGFNNKAALNVEFDEESRQLSISSKQYFLKRFAIPLNALTDKIAAKWNDEEATLTVSVPKKQQQKNSFIPIHDANVEQVAQAVPVSREEATQEEADDDDNEELMVNDSDSEEVLPSKQQEQVEDKKQVAQDPIDEWAPIVEDDVEFQH